MTKNTRSILIRLFGLTLAAALILSLILIAGGELPMLTEASRTHKLTDVTYESLGEAKNITLPATLKNLAPRTPVTLRAQIPAGQSSLLVKSVFSPLRVFINETLAYEYGQPSSYPGFMNDPPTGIMMIPLPISDEGVSLRLEYLSPSQRSEISLPVIYTGGEGALLSMMFRAEGFSLLFSFVLIFVGVAMPVISLVFVRKAAGGMSFLWLGLFSLAAGIWVLGECDLSTFIIPYPALLYGMAYLGLFCSTVTFLKFGLIILNPKSKLSIKAMVYAHLISIAAALILQLTGTADLMKTLYWFHIIAPLGFVIFAVTLIWEHFRHGNKDATRFAPAIILLASSVVLEILNYWLKFAGSFTAMFQLGLLAFILLLGVESGRYIRETIQAAAERRRLAADNASLDRLNRLKTELMETISHEARTPLAVLASYADLVSMELRETGVNAQIAADLDKIAEEAVRVANLIDSMRKLTLTGGETAKHVPLDISEIAGQTAELYRHILLRAGVELKLIAEENLPPVLGSPEELTQVFLNLLQNAKNHTVNGEIAIQIENGELRMENESNSQFPVTVSVTDTGCGIAAELLPSVFERGVTDGGGSGIGLSLCKEIIEAHGGTIEIESEPGGGTSVTFTLPIHNAQCIIHN